jgi:hypothetical protein
VFDDQQCPARPQCQGKQHTRSDRVHAAGNGKEPAIQFRASYLVGLQQHPRCRRHQHHGHHEEKASEHGNHPKDDHPHAVRPGGCTPGVYEDPLLILMPAYLKATHPKRQVCATADSRPSQTGAETRAAQDRDRPRGGRSQLSYPKTKQMGRGAHRDQYAGQARQCRGPDHGNPEQDVADHEQNCR